MRKLWSKDSWWDWSLLLSTLCGNSSGVGYCGHKLRSPLLKTRSDNLPLKPGLGQKIAMHALPTARNFFLVLMLTFLVHSFSFLPKSSPCFLIVLLKTVT